MAETWFFDPVAALAEHSLLARSSSWVRSGRSGIIQREIELGTHVERGDGVSRIYDTFGKKLGDIRSRTTGMVIGHTQHPLVNRGDAIVHIAALVDGSDDRP